VPFASTHGNPSQIPERYRDVSERLFSGASLSSERTWNVPAKGGAVLGSGSAAGCGHISMERESAEKAIIGEVPFPMVQAAAARLGLAWPCEANTARVSCTAGAV